MFAHHFRVFLSRALELKRYLTTYAAGFLLLLLSRYISNFHLSYKQKLEGFWCLCLLGYSATITHRNAFPLNFIRQIGSRVRHCVPFLFCFNHFAFYSYRASRGARPIFADHMDWKNLLCRFLLIWYLIFQFYLMDHSDLPYVHQTQIGHMVVQSN